MKQFIIIIAAIVVTVMIYSSYQPTETEEIDATWIMGEIKGIGKYSVYQNTYTSDVIDSNQSETLKKEFTDKFSTKRFVLFYYATLKLGFDMEKIKIEPYPELQKVYVSIPKIEVISHNVEKSKDVKIVLEENGWWNTLQPEDQDKIIEMEKKKKEEEILREVSQKQTAEFKEYLAGEIRKFTTYEVTFDPIPNINNNY